MRIRCTTGPAGGEIFEAAVDRARGAILIEGDPYTPTDARLNGFEVVEASGEELLALRAAGFDLPPRR